MADLLDESLVSLSEATHYVPGRPHVSTVWRWTTRGLRGVKLETIHAGGKRFTSLEAIRRFLVATQTVASQSIS
jgi:hypothetical protein